MVQAAAKIRYLVRAAELPELWTLVERVKKIAEGAALMTNTRVEVDVMSAVWPVRGNRTLAELMQRELELVGLPEWSQQAHRSR